MKFDHAWTLAGKPRGETPAPPPGRGTLALPRLPARRALLRQTGKYILRAMLAAGRRQPLGFGEHGSSAGVRQLAAQPRRHNPRLSYPPPSHKGRLGKICTGQRLSHGARGLLAGAGLGRLTATGLFPLVEGFGNWFGFLERRVATPSRLRYRAPWSEAIKRIEYCLNHSARTANSGVMAFTPLSLAPAKPR